MRHLQCIAQLLSDSSIPRDNTITVVEDGERPVPENGLVPRTENSAMTETSLDTSRITASPVTGERIRVSVVIPTLNESARLAKLLPTLSWAEDVIVVDGGSTDDTATVARNGGARVLEVRGQTIGAQRNAGIVAARHQWILALDADEMTTPELREDLATLVARSDATITA